MKESIRVKQIILFLAFLFLSVLSFLNGLVLFYEVEPIAPEFWGIAIRIITAVIWGSVAFLITRNARTPLAILFILTLPIGVTIAHCAGLHYLTTRNIGEIITNDALLYPTMEFISGIIVSIEIIILLIVKCSKTREHKKG